MPKKMLIDATHAEETRVVVVDGNRIEEFDFESLNKRQLAGNIYLAKVTRVEPSLQAAFVDYGGGRHGFLAFSEIHPDYYQIPMEDRQKLIDEEEESGAASKAEDDEPAPKPTRTRKKAVKTIAAEVETDTITGDAPDMNAPDTSLSSDAPAHTGADAPADMGDGAQNPKPSDDANDVMDGKTPDDQLVDVPESENNDKPNKKPRRRRGRDKGDDSTGDDLSTMIATRRARSQRYNIQEVIKHGQILLVQVVKEERGTKGAAMTTYLSLAGRYCVLMPNTSRGGGISRKIVNVSDRKKLKAIVDGIETPKGAALIVRTAGSQRSKTDIERDYDYLLRQWNAVRELTMKSVAPSQIYAEGDLIKRCIRDLYNRDIDEILVEGETAFNNAREYMQMLLPDHAKNVKLYNNPVSLFAKHQVEAYLATMFNPVVQLPSGGYIVINTTEALVAVDVNSGRSTKEDSIEETALLTNLEASKEVARQARLRDLAGLIVIDYIDMDEHKNNTAVEKCLKENLKNDRARIQIGGISNFGLLEMSRQRLNPTMLEATTSDCPHCQGSGIVRSEGSLALAILRKVKESAYHRACKEVLVTTSINVANYLLNTKREDIGAIEEQYQTSVRVEGSMEVANGEYALKEFKTASRMLKPVHENTDGLVSAGQSFEMDSGDDTGSGAGAGAGSGMDDGSDVRDMGADTGGESGDAGRESRGESGRESGRDFSANSGGETGDDGNKKRRRRRRGGKGRGQDSGGDTGANTGDMSDSASVESAAPTSGSFEPSSGGGSSFEAGGSFETGGSFEPTGTSDDSEAKPKPARRRKKASEVINGE
ncbi:MAG: Rne/Rng family ribonuclease [Candidatus Halichondribacter symbioticus]